MKPIGYNTATSLLILSLVLFCPKVSMGEDPPPEEENTIHYVYDYQYRALYDYRFNAKDVHDPRYDLLMDVYNQSVNYLNKANSLNANAIASSAQKQTETLRKIVLGWTGSGFNTSSISQYQTYKMVRPLAADAAATNRAHSSAIDAWAAGLNTQMKTAWTNWLNSERQIASERWKNYTPPETSIIGPNQSPPRQNVAIGQLAATDKSDSFECIYGGAKGAHGTVGTDSVTISAPKGGYCEDVF